MKGATVAGKTGVLLWLLLLLGIPAKGEEPAAETGRPACVIDFFYEPGCAECRRIQDEVLPELTARLAEDVEVRRWDVTSERGYERRIKYQRSLQIESNASSLAVVDGRLALAGWSQIREQLIPAAEMCVARKMAEVGKQPSDRPPPPVSEEEEPRAADLAVDQLRDFSALGVALAGLADGINPCAIATLVFMVSLLAALRVRGPQLLMTGAVFCLATFLTYFAIGFGLLRVLDSLSGIAVVQQILEGAMIVVLGALALLSFSDAWRYARTGRADAVILKLPKGGSRLVRRVVHTQFRRRNIMLGAFVAGALVTAIESVCTGQVYVPTLVYLVRVKQESGTALGYLVLYNVMFLLPLIIAFALAYAGLETERFLQFSRRNVVLAKVLLGLLFIGLGLSLALL